MAVFCVYWQWDISWKYTCRRVIYSYVDDIMIIQPHAPDNQGISCTRYTCIGPEMSPICCHITSPNNATSPNQASTQTANNGYLDNSRTRQIGNILEMSALWRSPVNIGTTWESSHHVVTHNPAIRTECVICRTHVIVHNAGTHRVPIEPRMSKEFPVQ